MKILVTGGTGYVGGRLISLLEQRGADLRLMGRRPEHLRARVSGNHEFVKGDVSEPTSLVEALRGIHTAYYFIHSMGSGEDFVEQDRTAARNFAAAARQNGVQRIIYLGGLGDEAEDLSRHLQSRHEVGRILREAGAVVIEFRASIVIGSGSLSFELIRGLVQKLPVMLCPRWVETPAQPIAIEDVLAYLAAALDLDVRQSRIYEIGGPDQVSYGDIMREYARQRHLRRLMIPVPFLSPRLSGLWLGLVTPVYARIGRELVESLRNPTVLRDDSALKDFDIRPLGLTEAIERALANEDQQFAQTRWQDAVSSARKPQAYGGKRFGNRLVDSRSVVVAVSPEETFGRIQRIGGQTGWYYANFLWRLRGLLDLFAAGLASFQFDPGDRLLVYTDAFSESKDARGGMLSPQKLREVMNEAAPASSEEVLPTLMRRLREWNPANLAQDDATAILMEPTGHRIPMTQNLLAPWRMIRRVHEMSVEAGPGND